MSDFDPDAYLAGQQPLGGGAVSPPPPGGASGDFNPDQYLNEQKYGTVGQQIGAGLEGVARGVAGPLATAAETASGLTTPEAIKGRQEVNPITAGASEVAGLVGSSMAGIGEGALLSKAGEAAKGLVAAGDALKAVPLTSRLGAAYVQGAAENVLYGAGKSVNESLLGDHEALGEKLLPTIGFNALIGGAGGAALSALGTGASKLASLADKESFRPDNAVKKIVGQAMGVSPDTISDYIRNREAVNSVPDFDSVVQHASSHLQGIQDDLSTAKESYGALERSMTDDFRQRGYDAATASRAAKAALSEAQERLSTQTLTDALNVAPSVSSSLQTLRNHVGEGSQAAYDILEQSGKSVDLQPLYAKGQELMDSLSKQGTIESQAAATRIGQQLETLKGIHPTGVVPATDAKALIKGLDGISQWSMGNSAEANNMAKQFRQLRHTLDSSLKEQVPEYAQAMQPVANDSKLLERLDNYATPEDAARRIKGLSNPVNYKNEMPYLQQLEKRVGTPLTENLEKYSNPELRKSMEASLPEAKSANAAAAALEELKNPESKKAFAAALHESPEFKALQEAQAIASKFKGVGQGNLESVLKKAISGNKIDATRLMAQIPGMEGKTLPEILDALRIKQAFEKGAMNGSRNTNAYGVLGAVLGEGLHGASPLGFGLGAISGHIVDIHGPSIAKKLIDAYVDRQGMVSGLGSLNRAATSLSDKITSGAKKIFSDSGPAIAPAAAKWDYDKVTGWLKDYNGNFNDAANGTASRTQDIHKIAPRIAASLQGKTGGAAAFLQSKLPTAPTPTPFQPSLQPSQSDKAKFKSYYDTVSQPTHVLDAVRNGTVTPAQIETLKTVYPRMYQEMQQQVYQQMIDHTQKGKTVPYQTRLGVSLFMGSPLDSTMQPASIIAAQPKPSMAPPQQPQGQKLTQHAGDKLGKMSKGYQTKSQAAESDQSSRD